ncbi:Abi family protein [Desulfurispora thermophila]|uniref:Abi family protein n=1 Tax=Desulfurispora thermophila TaxID=265470 RepID=UPI000369C7D8|nr:Abi family protein [Desulfurispora thermophila]
MACSEHSLDEFPKPPLSIEEQIKLLVSRGLVVEDETFATDVLNHVGYYRLSGYTLSLKTGDLFHEGVTFQKVYNIYEFDQKLRYLLLGIIEIVEIAFRAQIANYMALKYGALGYLNRVYFSNGDYHKKFLDELNDQITKNQEKELFVKHHIEKYEGKFPIWVAVEVFSLGMLSKFFKNMKTKDQKAISRKFYAFSHEYISSWLHSLVNLRNICAHYGRLYNRRFTIMPKFSKDAKIKGIQGNSLFACIFLLKYLVNNKKKWNNFLINLQAIVDEYKDDIDISLMGFPDNWYEVLS